MLNTNALYLILLCERPTWTITSREHLSKTQLTNFGVLVYTGSRKPREETFFQVLT